jgi:hypothetical protein
LSIALSICGAGTDVHARPIDFTPIEIRTIEDGIPAVRTAFRDGTQKIFFRAAKGWRMAGGGNELKIYPKDRLDGYIRMANSPIDRPLEFAGEGRAVYRASARSALPRAATHIEVLSEKTDAYPLDDWKSFEMHFAYEVNGVENRCWVLFITMTPERRIWYVADARKTDFDAVYAAARSMLGSWFDPPPGWPPAPPSR